VWTGLAAASLVAVPSAAGQETAPEVSLEEAVRLFAENGLEMRIARAEMERETGEARQSRAYMNPGVSLIHENLDHEDFDYDETILALSQPVEWPWRTSARGRAAEAQTDAAAARFRADSLELVFEVRRTYLEAWALEERTEGLERAAEVVREAVRASELRLAEGDISDYDTRRLSLEQVRLEQMLAVSELDRSSSRRRLATLVFPDGPHDEVFAEGPPAAEPPSVILTDTELALARNPELAAAESRLDAADETARVAGMSWIPPLTLTAGYKDQSDGFTGPVLGVSLPLPLFDRRGGESEAAEARLHAASAEVTLRRRQAENQLRRATERYESATARLQRLGAGVISEATELLETAGLAYREGEFTLLQLIDAAEAFQQSRFALIDLRAEAWVAYYDLERSLGGPLPYTTDDMEAQDEQD
jgi:cobalt-zinc-cadmium efflux system outer membrane protein